MTDAIHISQARKMLDTGQPLDITAVKKSGEVMELKNVVSLKYHFYKGTRTVKLLQSRRVMTLRDVMILRVNEFRVFI